MKKSLWTILVMLVLLASSSLSHAQGVFDGTFNVNATIPNATSVVFVISEVIGGQFPANPIISNSETLNFPMSFNTTNGIWLPDRYFVIDVSPRANAGATPAPANNLVVSFSYLNNVVPTGQVGAGLDAKGVLTAERIEGGPAPADQVPVLIGKERFGTISTLPISNSDIVGGFLRVTLGIATGDTAADPAGAEPFTNSDVPGTYSGTVVISATLS